MEQGVNLVFQRGTARADEYGNGMDEDQERGQRAGKLTPSPQYSMDLVKAIIAISFAKRYVLGRLNNKKNNQNNNNNKKKQYSIWP